MRRRRRADDHVFNRLPTLYVLWDITRYENHCRCGWIAYGTTVQRVAREEEIHLVQAPRFDRILSRV